MKDPQADSDITGAGLGGGGFPDRDGAQPATGCEWLAANFVQLEVR